MKRFVTNHDYFDIIDSDRAYIIGYILADGCIYKNTNGTYSLSIGLSQMDINFLQFVIDRLRPGDSPRLYNFTQKSGYVSNLCSIVITSNKICNTLISLGIIPRKTGKEYLPDIDENYLPDMIRGLFDGDGCICKKKREHVFSITSGGPLIVNQLKDLFNCGHIEHYPYMGNTWHYKVNRIEDLEKIYNYMYYSNNVVCLKRKRDIFDNIPKPIRYLAFGEFKTLQEWLIDKRCLAKATTISYRINNTNLSFEECITITPNKRNLLNSRTIR